MSVFHLHIPRTSGGYIRKMMLQNLEFSSKVVGHYRTLSIEAFDSADLISGHYGRTPAKYADKTFTVIREPNELTFSYIKYLALFKGQDAFNEDHLKRYLYEDNLRESVTNVLSKFLSLELDLPKYNSRIGNLLHMANNSWYLQSGDVSVESALSFIDRHNVKVFSYGSNNMVRFLAEYLNISVHHLPDRRVNVSGPDKFNLYEKYFFDIEKANYIDIDLYKRLEKNDLPEDL
jgi:hypothetical protein